MPLLPGFEGETPPPAADGGAPYKPRGTRPAPLLATHSAPVIEIGAGIFIPDSPFTPRHDMGMMADEWEANHHYFIRGKQRIRTEGGTRAVVVRVGVEGIAVMNPSADEVYAKHTFKTIKSFKLLPEYQTFAYLHVINDESIVFEYVLPNPAALNEAVHEYMHEAILEAQAANRTRARNGGMLTDEDNVKEYHGGRSRGE